MQVSLDIRVAYLDLESGKALLRRFAEQSLEIMIREVEIEPACIDGDPLAFGAEHSPERQTHLLGNEIPDGVLDSLFKREPH